MPAHRAMATYICGGPEDVPAGKPCPKGGPDHDPRPAGYDADYEYAAQLLHGGWRQHRCPGCGLFTLWRHPEPQPLPPMLPRPDGEPWELPDDVDESSCPHCDGEDPCPAVTAGAAG